MPRPRLNRRFDKRLMVIKKWLNRGDLVLVAKATGYSLNYVWMVMRGMRWNREIIMTALERAKQNRDMIKQKEQQLTEVQN